MMQFMTNSFFYGTSKVQVLICAAGVIRIKHMDWLWIQE